MNKRILSPLAWLLALLLALTACGGQPTQEEQTAAWLQGQIPEATVGSIGGDWLIFGLARSGCRVPESYFETYYRNVEQAVTEKGGVLHEKKYTEYSRLVLALTAMGKDPANVAGYDLLRPLGDFQKVTKQGINGGIFALLALDSGGYEVPRNQEAAVQATRQLYVEELLGRELEGGGWALTGDIPDADITAMTLQALAKYREQPAVEAAVARGVEALAAMQQADGGFSSWDTPNSESVSQVIVALTELGIPLDDPRFARNGETLEQVLLRFSNGEGGFFHVQEGGLGDDLMATEQALYALVALRRAETGKTTLYDMTDVRS